MDPFDLKLNWYDYVVYIGYILIYGYTLLAMGSYLILGIISISAARTYVKRNAFLDYKTLLNSKDAPRVSILAPAFNEEASIIDNIRSLLSVQYQNFEVVVINDGSKDSTLQRCIDAFKLQPVPTDHVHQALATKPVRQMYRSTNPALSHLLVVDKENGGKADALNVGINFSSGDYIMNIDVDCILESDCLLKLMKPFLEAQDKRIIATGGVIRLANNCAVEKGRIKTVDVPNTWIERFQALEYLRAFLLGRMAWGKLDGLLLISGALGVFDKELVISCGGYDHSTVGEDMELVVRMRRYATEHKIPYGVGYVPDPLCWTEVPSDWGVLSRQRNRWTRGTIETLERHWKLFLNPKYGKIGLISYPYWLVFEWLAPLIEFFGLIYLGTMAFFGLVNLPFFLLMVATIYIFSVSFTVATLYVEESTFFQYSRRDQLVKLFFAGVLEPLVYHPFVVWNAVKGNWDLFFNGKKQWGAMKRTGFNKPS